MLSPATTIHLPKGASLVMERVRLEVPGQPEQDAAHLVILDAHGIRLAVLSVLGLPPADAIHLDLVIRQAADPAQATLFPAKP